MNPKSSLGSATIIAFPSVRRMRAPAHNVEMNDRTVLAKTKVVATEIGSAWYHDAAVLEAELARKS